MRRTAEIEDVAGLVRHVWETKRRVTGMDRLRGGSKKGVYRVHLEDQPGSDSTPSVIVYSWADAENFWPSTQPDPMDPFAPATGLQRFLDAQRMLESIGVRAPRVLWSDDTHEHYPADVAVVEDLSGGTLEALYESDPARAETITRDLAENLARLHAHRADTFGTLDQVSHISQVTQVEQVKQVTQNRVSSCEQVILERALVDLDEAAHREPRIGAPRGRFAQRLNSLREQVAPRQEYALIHGELGPDHVLPDLVNDQAVLIDIEGLMFFDVEWEHVFLELRFGERYPWVAGVGADRLDQQRLALYRLAMRLSLVAGPLRLLDGDYPDRAFMLHIAESNTQAALALLGE